MYLYFGYRKNKGNGLKCKIGIKVTVTADTNADGICIPKDTTQNVHALYTYIWAQCVLFYDVTLLHFGFDPLWLIKEMTCDLKNKWGRAFCPHFDFFKNQYQFGAPHGFNRAQYLDTIQYRHPNVANQQTNQKNLPLHEKEKQ